jgi:hypothetical protein
MGEYWLSNMFFLTCPTFIPSTQHFRPFNNPTETYRYYSLPFCSVHADEDEHKAALEEEVPGVGDGEEEEDFSTMSASSRRIMADRVGAERHKQRLGESIAGDRRETSPYELSFQDDIEWRLLCKTTLGEKELTKLKEAIHNSYFFEMFVEDLPMWGYVGDFEDEDAILGEMEGSRTYLFPHLHFKIGTNNAQIVSVTVTTERDRRVDITNVNKPTTVQFSYSVEWFEDHELPWKMRMTRYADSRFLPGSFEIHWLSIINSFVLVLLLTAFLTIILMRVLKNDFSRYMDLDDETMEEEEVNMSLFNVKYFADHHSDSISFSLLDILMTRISVWVEVDSRRRLPFPRIPCPLLRRGRDRSAAHACHLPPPRIGIDRSHLHDKAWVHPRWNGRSLLPHMLNW